MASASNDYGAATASELLAAAVDAYGRQPDVSNTPLEIMVEKVLSIVRRRLASPATAAAEQGTKSFAIFLLSSDLRQDRSKLQAERVHTVDTGSEQLSGNVWIAPPTLASAGRRQIEAADIASALEAVEAHEFGQHAAIVVDFKHSQIAVYRAGVAAEDDIIKLTIGSDEPVNLDVSELLETFARQCVVTPNCQTSSIKTWEDGGAYRPTHSAEKKIQELLFLYLRARLGESFQIKDEVTLRSGRVDLVINRRIGSGAWQTVAAVELKVARSFSSTGRATPSSALIRHMRRGYGQIREYRSELQAQQGWLVLYDMRAVAARSVDLFAAHRSDAGTAGIRLYLEPLYGTADDYRDACGA